jgi:predicted outer membrane protein
MHKAIGWSVISFALVGGVLLAQQPLPRPGVQPGAQPGAQPRQPGVQPRLPGAQPGQPGAQIQQGNQQGDQQIATLILNCNRNEVEASKFALDKLQSSEAKEIATKMIKDHTDAMNKFARWAGPGAQPGAGFRQGQDNRDDQPRDSDRRDENRRDDQRSEARPATQPGAAQAAATQPGAAPGQPGAANPNPATSPRATAQGTQGAAQGAPQTVFRPVTGDLNWAVIHQEIADQALADCKKELSRYEGKEFDKAYLGHQLAAHMKVATELKVLKRYASSQLGAEIDSALSMTEEHIKLLRDTMEEKKDERSERREN